MRKSWIEGDLIVFPAGFTKNKREHRIPLGSQAQKVVTSIAGDTDMLFPARGMVDSPFNGWGKAKRVFDLPLQIAPYTLHDLRRTFASKMAEMGTPIHVTERILNHVSGTVSGITAVYNRYSYMEEMKAAIANYERATVEKFSRL